MVPIYCSKHFKIYHTKHFMSKIHRRMENVFRNIIKTTIYFYHVFFCFFFCRMLKEWPNTYAMTKAIAEGEIATYGKGLPIGVVRPSVSKY